MAGLLDLYANDELMVMKEQRLCDLQSHRNSKQHLPRQAYENRRDDIVGEISLIDDELSFRKTLSASQNLSGFSFED